MNGWDILILILVAALIVLAVFLYRRGSKKGSCCGDCEKCRKDCAEPKEKF